MDKNWSIKNPRNETIYIYGMHYNVPPNLVNTIEGVTKLCRQTKHKMQMVGDRRGTFQCPR